MKKLFCTALLSAVLCCAAGAADVGTIDNGYPGDVEAQAQMLHDLGLLQGTDKGFELEKPMTRAEAAVMLTRLLGAEEEALAGEWTHPFTDVPQWADKYVGWLYKNGLTKGVSATAYGARQDVTCGQYATFLARAVSDGEETAALVVFDEEATACGAAGFVRGDAVSLSARALSSGYHKGQSPVRSGFTLAGYLAERGVFTPDALKAAAWDVLPRYVARVDENGEPFGEEGDLCCLIAGVPVVRNEQTEMRPDSELRYKTGREYGYREDETTGERITYAIDPETLETTRLFTCAAEQGVYAMCSAAERDYIRAGTRLLSVAGTVVKTENATFDPEEHSLLTVSDERGRCAFACAQGLCVIDGDAVRTIGQPGIGRLYGQAGGLLIAEDETEERTNLSAWTWDGAAAGSYTAENDCPPEQADKRSLYAPRLECNDGIYVWGGVGLYKAENDRLTRITTRAVYGFAQDKTDDSCVVITCEPSKRVIYIYGAGACNAGDEVMRIAADGTETLLLADTPAHDLQLIGVSYAADGEVRVVHTVTWGMQDRHIYEYAVENGKLRALCHELGTGFAGYTEEDRQAEQARLDDLGVGVNAP